MSEAYIVDALRTAVGKKGGALSGVHPADLGAGVITQLLGRSGSTHTGSMTSSSAASTRSARRPATSPAPPGWRRGFPRRFPG